MTSILLRNTMRIHPGSLAGYREAIDKAVGFAEANAPQLMVEVFIDEENLRAYSFQLYPDSESIQRHWQLSDPYIQDVMQHCEVERLDVYGDPSREVMDGIEQFGKTGATVTHTPRYTGFTRIGS